MSDTGLPLECLTIFDVPMSGPNEGQEHGVDLLAGSLTPEQVVRLMPPCSVETGLAAIRLMVGDP